MSYTKGKNLGQQANEKSEEITARLRRRRQEEMMRRRQNLLGDQGPREGAGDGDDGSEGPGIVSAPRDNGQNTNHRVIAHMQDEDVRDIHQDLEQMIRVPQHETSGHERSVHHQQNTFQRNIDAEEEDEMRELNHDPTTHGRQVGHRIAQAVRNIDQESEQQLRDIERQEINVFRTVQQQEDEDYAHFGPQQAQIVDDERYVFHRDEDVVREIHHDYNNLNNVNMDMINDDGIDYDNVFNERDDEQPEPFEFNDYHPEESTEGSEDEEQYVHREVEVAEIEENFQNVDTSQVVENFREVYIPNEEPPRIIRLLPREIEIEPARVIHRFPVREEAFRDVEIPEVHSISEGNDHPATNNDDAVEQTPEEKLDEIVQQIVQYLQRNVQYLQNRRIDVDDTNDPLSKRIYVINYLNDGMWTQLPLEERYNLLITLGEIPAHIALPDTVITVTLYTLDGNEHIFPLSAMNEENIPVTRQEWREFYDEFKENGEVLVCPVEEIMGVELVVNHRPVEVTPRMYELQGNFFPYYIHPSCLELKELFSALEIFEEKDWAPKENCFLKALEHWNEYLKKTGQEIKCISEDKLRKLKFRLRGNGLAKSQLDRIGKDFHLKFNLTIVTIKERLTEDMDQYIKNNSYKEEHGANNGMVVELGLIVIKEQGHYFANYPTCITKAGLKHYHWLKRYSKPFMSGDKLIAARTLQERLGVICVKESQGMKVHWSSSTKKGKTLTSAGVLMLMVKLNETGRHRYLIEIPNYMLYRGFCSSVNKKRITNVDLNERKDPDYKVLDYVVKDKKVIPFVADTECATQNRHRPYAISFAKLEENSQIETFIGMDCITKFVERMNRFMLKNVTKGKLNSGHIYQNYEVVVYFHNLSYDGRMFCDQKITSITMGANRIIEMVILTKDGYKLTLRDSLMLINFKLADFPKLFKFDDESKKIFPYSFIELEKTNYPEYKATISDIIDSQKWEQNQIQEFIEGLERDKLIVDNVVDIRAMIQSYIESDVKILRKGLIIFRNDLKTSLDLDLMQYISISSIAFDYMKREAFAGENIYQYTGEIRDFIRQAVYGGRCMTRGNNAYKMDNIKIDDIDACSLYPSAMSKLSIPKGAPLKKENPTREWLENGLKDGTINAAIVRITITDIGQTLQFPLICERDKNGVVQYENYVGGEMVVDDVQLLEMIKWQKIDYTIHECLYWNKGVSTKIQGVIRYLYEKRKEAKQQKSSIEQVYKLIMNSSYGKCIEMTHPYETVIVEGKNYINHLFQNYTNIQRIDEIASFDREIINNPMKEEDVDTTRQYIFREYKQYDNFFVPTMIGVRILSMSKKLMNEVMVPAELSGIIIFYQDTDSMHVIASQVPLLEDAWRQFNNKGPEEKLIGNDLCQFHSDFEPINGKPTQSCGSIFLGKKMYIDKLVPKEDMFSEQIKYMTRLKGIPRASMMNSDIEGFSVNDEKKLWRIYEKLFEGESIEFELVVEKIKMSFTRHLEVQTMNSFRRKANGPKCKHYELNDNDELVIRYN